VLPVPTARGLVLRKPRLMFGGAFLWARRGRGPLFGPPRMKLAEFDTLHGRAYVNPSKVSHVEKPADVADGCSGIYFEGYHIVVTEPPAAVLRKLKLAAR
jgi:hypothetical protein